MFSNEIFDKYFDFQWDNGNDTKSWNKHEVSQIECEQVFFNFPIIVTHDSKHSHEEIRYRLLGRTNNDRKLYLAFTLRRNLVRIISARDMDRNERGIYEETQKNS